MTKISVVGIGPGNKENMTIRALEAIEKAEVIVGYSTYISLIEDLIRNKEVIKTGMKGEVARCTKALDLAEQGNIVCVISSGDAGIYGMAGLILELKKERNSTVETEVIPGITSASACGALLGAPLIHDFSCISLSNLLTPWDVIEKRLDAAASSDMVMVIYNPKSKGRPDLINRAVEIISKYRAPKIPVGIVKNGCREGQSVVLTTLDCIDFNQIDMFTTIFVGNSTTFVFDNWMITPRGYTI